MRTWQRGNALCNTVTFFRRGIVGRNKVMDELGMRNVDCRSEVIGPYHEQTRSVLRHRLKSFSVLHPAV